MGTKPHGGNQKMQECHLFFGVVLVDHDDGVDWGVGEECVKSQPFGKVVTSFLKLST